MLSNLSIKVTRNAATYRLSFSDEMSGLDVGVTPSLSADCLEGGFQSYVVDSTELEITLDDINRRHFFHLTPAQGDSRVLAEHWLAFEGTPNFRDYGGYLTRDGQRVRWGKLYRSGQLASLSDTDIAYFDNLNIKTVFDFRRTEEAEKDVSLFPEVQPNVCDLPIDPGSTLNFFDSLADGNLTAVDMEAFMSVINTEFAIDHAPSYKKMFSNLLNSDSKASLVHCSAGKDRTGFAAAMILSALGVDRAIVMHDYLLTGEYFNIEREISRISKKYNWQGAHEVMRPMLAVNERYLSAAFKAIDDNFSTMDIYFEEMLGIGKEEKKLLQSFYLL